MEHTPLTCDGRNQTVEEVVLVPWYLLISGQGHDEIDLRSRPCCVQLVEFDLLGARGRIVPGVDVGAGGWRKRGGFVPGTDWNMSDGMKSNCHAPDTSPDHLRELPLLHFMIITLMFPSLDCGTSRTEINGHGRSKGDTRRPRVGCRLQCNAEENYYNAL